MQKAIDWPEIIADPNQEERTAAAVIAAPRHESNWRLLYRLPLLALFILPLFFLVLSAALVDALMTRPDCECERCAKRRAKQERRD
jgi:hypothetical protein